MANLIDILIPKVYAQSDAIAQPTFGEVNAGTSGSITSSVFLNWDSPALKVGDKFKVRVEVKTGDLKINEYRVVVKYNTDFLSVIGDQDPATPGVQVTLLDSLLTPTTPATDNLAADGLVVVDAKAPSGQDYQVNKEVVEIEFQVQKAGDSSITISQDVNGTRLTKLNGQPIAFNVNEIDVKASEANLNPSPQPNPEPQPSPLPLPVSGTVEPPPFKTGNNGNIPNTAVGDGPSFFLSIAFGISLILTGIALTFNRGKKKLGK